MLHLQVCEVDGKGFVIAILFGGSCRVHANLHIAKLVLKAPRHLTNHGSCGPFDQVNQQTGTLALGQVDRFSGNFDGSFGLTGRDGQETPIGGGAGRCRHRGDVGFAVEHLDARLDPLAFVWAARSWGRKEKH